MNYSTPASNAPTLETERLLLRPPVEADLDDLHRISNDPLVRRYLWDDEPVLRATIGEVIAQSTRMFSEEGVGLFGVRLRGGEELLGFCGFVRLEDMEEIELGYELAPEWWGRGLHRGGSGVRALRPRRGKLTARNRRGQCAQRCLSARA
jgi:RimJ/RimL family protein N-acetyltransferase